LGAGKSQWASLFRRDGRAPAKQPRMAERGPEM